ncbi:uncharacterized protein LOC112342990 [Selaginella moellendorffii]|uniref:uncharacterized protein LOC112342990 n=1 Tax=Selaginella moellendorffii TaxID=88036 RepID=UPI000D1D05B6|nr:uncharacterized protein LOC112342990 [Selaginella moellendorffii]|eukprot:XP_024521490.1 uncharacterized protein LOC112342990 [Selaginella moellendorffii]
MEELDWDEALLLPNEVQDFLDAYLEGKVSLPVDDDYGVPVYMKVPSMLLFRIGQSEHSCCAQLKEQLENAESLGRRCMIVSGVSGCGKTRSLYDLFCERDGFYFVVTALNGGSQDLEFSIRMLESFLIRAHRNPEGESLMELALNQTVARVFVTLLLACRMKIYLYCKSKNITSRQWLLLQAACRGLAQQDGVALLRDPFCEFFRGAVTKLCGLSRNQIGSQLEPLLHQLNSPVPIPTIALDEAQEAMKLFEDGYFWSTSRGGYVPFANCLENHCRVDTALKHVVIVSGTGYTLYFKQDLLCTGIGKLIADTDFVNFGIWENAKEMVNYAEQAIALTEDDEADLRTLYKVFKGRFRPLACVLEIMILKDLSLREAAAYVTVGLTTKRSQPETKKTSYGAVSKLAEKQAIVHGVNLIQELEAAVVQYFGAGRGYVFRDNEDICVALVEAGLGWLERTAAGCIVHVDEYLVLAAARNYFQDQHQAKGFLPSSYLPSKWLRLTAAVPYPSGQGLCLQNFLALSFESMWEKFGGKMADMPLLRPLLQASGCPQGFQELAARKGEVVKGLIDAFVSADGYDPEVFLVDLERDDPLCTTWISGDNTAGADAVRGIRYKFNEGNGDTEVYVMHVLEQHKFPKNALSSTNTGFPEDTEAYKLLSSIQLKLLVMPPQLKGDQCRYFWEMHAGGKKSGFVVLDAENAADLFGDESALEFLRRMKFGPSALQAEAHERKRNLPPPRVKRSKRSKFAQRCDFVSG